VREIPFPDVVARFLPSVELRRAGRNWIGCCPFHEDRNPSFAAYPERFYCFGCGTSGDAVDFVARVLSLRPIEAARTVARAFGLPVDEPRTPAARRQVREALQQAGQERALEDALQEYKLRVYRGLCLIHQAAARVAADPEHPVAAWACTIELYAEHLLDVLERGTEHEVMEVLREYGGLANV
jgi:DNA primase